MDADKHSGSPVLRRHLFERLFLLPVFLIFLNATFLLAQDGNREAEPREGVSALRAWYDRIDFTSEQRKELAKRPVEFSYRVDEDGNATLLDIKGVYDPAIREKLAQQSNTLPHFTPRIINNVPVACIYTISLNFKEIPDAPYGENDPIPPRTKSGEIESYEMSGKNLDVLFSYLCPFYMGNVSEYLYGGFGGIKFDCLLGNTKLNYGFVMDITFSSKQKDFPVNSTRQQNDYVTILLFGGAVNKTMWDKNGSRMILQGELMYALENVSDRLDKYDEGYIQFNGFSPGITGHYLLKLGNHVFGSEPSYRAPPKPVVYFKYIDFSLGLRWLYLSSKEASGIMIETSIGFRLSSNNLSSYKVKKK